jgi:hypothetical protein
LDQEHIYGFLFELAGSAQEHGHVLTRGRQAETQQHHTCLAVPTTNFGWETTSDPSNSHQ